MDNTTVQVKAEIPHTQSLNYLAETLLQFSHNVPTAPEQAVPEIRAFSNSKDERISESPIFQMDMQNDGRVHRGRDESPDNEDMEVVIDSPVHNDFIDSGGINAESEMLSPTGRPQRTCRTRPILSNIQPSPYKDRDLEVVDGDGEDDYDADEASPRSRSRRRGTPNKRAGGHDSRSHSRTASHDDGGGGVKMSSSHAGGAPISSRHFTTDRFGITVEDLMDAGYIKPGKGVITFCNSDSIDCTVVVDGVARTLARTALMIANKSRAGKGLPARRGINAWSYCFYENEKLDAIRDRLARDMQSNANRTDVIGTGIGRHVFRPSRESSQSREHSHSPVRRRGRSRISLKDVTLSDLLSRGFVREGKGVLRLGSLDGELADVNADGTVTWNNLTGDVDTVAVEAYNYRRTLKNLPSRKNIDVLMHCFFNNVALDILRAECAGLMEEQYHDDMVDDDRVYSASFNESTLIREKQGNAFVSEEESEHLDRAMERSRSNSRTRNYNDEDSDEGEDEDLVHRKSVKSQKDQNSPSRFGVTMKDLMQAGLLLPGKCSITFRRSEDTADLLDDGSVVYNGEVTSVGIAALHVTNSVREHNRLPPSVNAWQVALYDGHKLDDYRQEFVTLVKKERLTKSDHVPKSMDGDGDGIDLENESKRSRSRTGSVPKSDAFTGLSELLIAADNAGQHV